MRIHTSATLEDVREAGKVARVTFTTLAEHGSRSRDRAFEVILSGESSRWPNGGRDTMNGKAATWDQWGVFLAHLFDVDPQLRCQAYDGAYDFHMQTTERFADGWPDDAHGDHSWDWTSGGGRCRRCSAHVLRAMEMRG